MSAGLPYLKSLRKGDLLNLADVSDLKQYVSRTMDIESFDH